jgi:hypothetical protein
MNHKKLYRLYREERLTVRRRSGRKRTLGTRSPMELPHAINQRWSLDFVQQIHELAKGVYIAKAEPIIFIGDAH